MRSPALATAPRNVKPWLPAQQGVSAEQQRIVFIEKLKLGTAGNLDIRKNQTEGAGRCCGTCARQKETHVRDITVDGSEQPLRRERLEIAWEAKQRRVGCSCVRADQETGAGRAEHDAARRVDVKEVGGQQVWVGTDVRDAIPVDLAAESAERTVRPYGSTSAYGGAEGVAGRRDRGRVSAGRLESHETAIGSRNRKHQRSCEHSFEQHNSILFQLIRESSQA